MPDDTTFLQRSATKLGEHKGKVAVTGVSAATLVACYSIFVSQSNFNERMQQEKEVRSEHWRFMQEQDKRIDDLDKRMDIHAAVHAARLGSFGSPGDTTNVVTNQ